jgi:tetratricopeptide (TPR) repeat protein
VVFLVHWLRKLAGMWKPILPTSILGMLLSGLSVIAWTQAARDLVQDAMTKQQAGDLEGAVEEYRQFLKIHPEATAIHSNLGAALAGLGRFGEAVPEYKFALKQSPSVPGARLNLALAYYKMGHIGDAASELARVHSEAPANLQAALLLGDCYLQMGRNKDVIRVLEPQEKKHPDELGIAYLLGTAYIRNSQVEQGQVLVERIMHNGDSAEAHMMLGSAKMNVGDFAGAREEFAKAAGLDPKLPEVHLLYAKTLVLTGDSDEAAKEFKAELVANPFNFDSNLQLGAMARQEQNYKDARQYFERALETRPGDPGVRYQLALLALDEGKLEVAQRVLESLVKESPQFTEAHVSLSLVYYRLKRPADGKRERDIVQQLTAAAQAKQLGAKSQ